MIPGARTQTPDQRPIKHSRLVFREEGDFINCYFAPIDSMTNAVLLSSLRASVANIDPKLFNDYREMMKEWVMVACPGLEPEPGVIQ